MLCNLHGQRAALLELAVVAHGRASSGQPNQLTRAQRKMARLLALGLCAAGALAGKGKKYEDHTMDALAWLKENTPSTLIVDVRTKAEYETGHLEGAVHVQAVPQRDARPPAHVQGVPAGQHEVVHRRLVAADQAPARRLSGRHPPVTVCTCTRMH